jgi:site-specific recombinase XerD
MLRFELNWGKPKKKVEEAINDYLLHAESKGLSTGSIKHRKADLNRLLEFLSGHGLEYVTDVEPHHLWAFMSGLYTTPKKVGKGKLSISYVGRIFKSAKAFFRWCYHMEIIGRDLMLKVDPPPKDKKIKRPLEADEVKLLLKTAVDPQYYRADPTRDRTIILVLVDTMLRVNELCNLRIENLEPSDEGGKTTIAVKGGREYLVFFSPTSWEAIQELIEELSVEDGPLFIGRGGDGLTDGGIRRVVERIAKRAGIDKRVYPHKLGRRTGATLRSMRGATAQELQQLGRWEKIDMLRRYVVYDEAVLGKLNAQTSPLPELVDGLS